MKSFSLSPVVALSAVYSVVNASKCNPNVFITGISTNPAAASSFCSAYIATSHLPTKSFPTFAAGCATGQPALSYACSVVGLAQIGAPTVTAPASTSLLTTTVFASNCSTTASGPGSATSPTSACTPTTGPTYADLITYTPNQNIDGEINLGVYGATQGFTVTSLTDSSSDCLNCAPYAHITFPNGGVGTWDLTTSSSVIYFKNLDTAYTCDLYIRSANPAATPQILFYLTSNGDRSRQQEIYQFHYPQGPESTYTKISGQIYVNPQNDPYVVDISMQNPGPDVYVGGLNCYLPGNGSSTSSSSTCAPSTVTITSTSTTTITTTSSTTTTSPTPTNCPSGFSQGAISYSGANYQLTCGSTVTGGTFLASSPESTFGGCLAWCNSWGSALCKAALYDTSLQQNCQLFTAYTGTSGSGTAVYAVRS